MSQPVDLTKKKKNKIEDYEVEGAMNDLMRAEKHKENPELMKRVAALAGRHSKQLSKIKSIEDLKKLRNKSHGYDTDGDDE